MPSATRSRRKAAAIPTFELTQFTWVKEKATLLAEASTIFGPLNVQLQTGLPVRFNVHSPKTGRVEQFQFTGPIMQDAEDIGAWVYVSVDTQCPVKRIVIYND